jgi:aminoglycoside phosphotransferase (APT) family kinase protein
VRLIDWEYLRSSDPTEDLAYLTAEQPLDDVRWSQIAAGYRAAGGDPRTLERAARYRHLVALDAALWWADYLLEHGHDPTARPEVIHRVVLAESLLMAESR